MRKPGFLLVAVVLGVLALFAWWQRSERMEAERRLGLDASRVVAESFSNAAQVKVGTLSGRIVSRGEDRGFLGVVPSEQTSALPFSVDYFIDLNRIGQGDYRWDEATKTLNVAIPDVTVSKPNIDETAASSRQKGVYISRRAAQELAQQTSRHASARSMQAAREPQRLDQARANARTVVSRMAQPPLQAAGLGEVKVVVKFPWETGDKSTAGERWDQSRRPEEVLEERRGAQK
ncbi:MAG TPA: DUF4230 domain-containing protein [Allosphingosinicella sp.]|nr:DUF4230 domain-containing protein [Allosphingosinicella sp.]